MQPGEHQHASRGQEQRGQHDADREPPTAAEDHNDNPQRLRKMRTPCPRGSRMRVCERLRQNALRTMQTTGNPMRREHQNKVKQTEEKTGQTKASQLDEKDEGEPPVNTAENERPQMENDDPAALDKLLRQLHERGPAPGSIHGVDTENGPTRGHDILDQTGQRQRTSSRNGRRKRVGGNSLADQHASVRCTKRITQQSPETKGKRRRRKDEIKECNQIKMLKEIRRRLQLAEKGEWQPHGQIACASKDTGEGSLRARERDVTSPARQHERSMPSAGWKRPCTTQLGQGRKKFKSVVAMEVTSDEHKELENARKEANTMRSKVPEMTTGAVKSGIRVLKAGAAPGSSGLRNNHIRAIEAAPGGLQAIAAWMTAWTKWKKGHQEMIAWNAALTVPFDRDGTRVRPIAITEAPVKLAQGTLKERIHRKLRRNAEPIKSKMRREGTTHRTVLGENINRSSSPGKNRAGMSERQTNRDTGPARPLERVRECPQTFRPAGGQEMSTRNELHACTRSTTWADGRSTGMWWRKRDCRDCWEASG